MIRLAVRVGRADAEAVLAELLELAPSGLEEREAGADAVEYVLYGAPGELPDLGEVRAAAGSALVDVSTSEIPDDWSERWKAYHRPVDVSWRFRRLRVRPPWAPTVVANLPLDLLLAVPYDRPPERLIASGFLNQRAGELAIAFDMREVERSVQGEWAGVVLERP